MVGVGTLTLPTTGAHDFLHEAVVYEGPDQLVELAAEFIDESVAADEPILVVLAPEVLGRLASKHRLPGVTFADMRAVGGNPARLLPACQEFLDRHASSGRRVRGLGEPVWSTRRAAELGECHQHEALLNAAFDRRSLWLRCPYDAGSLDPGVIEEACRTHPLVQRAGQTRPSPSYPGAAALATVATAPLPVPPGSALQLEVGPGDLGRVRQLARERATAAGLSSARTEDLVVAVNELAANSLAHGGGRGTVRLWEEDGVVLCELHDRGRLDDPWVGRRRPPTSDTGGRGLWLANQLCDLVQIRSGDQGTVVRLHQEIDRST
jgi:anti-sigma regulatory factor (Ser/Thr protein kinase)